MRAHRMIRIALIAAALMPPTTAAALPGCQTSTIYEYCGDHWRAENLPIRLFVDPSGAPVSLKSSAITAAVAGASQAWNLAWPLPTGFGVSVFRVAGSASATAVRDGRNVVGFGNPALCGGRADALAVACTWYEGTAGTGAQRIAEVDVIVNPTVAWRVASGAQLATGEAAGLTQFPFVGLCPTPWFDLQSTLTHELGHALGLRHIGSSGSYFPQQGLDVHQFTQTMYRWDYPCTTNKRTLDTGDIAGAQQVALATYSD